VTTTTEIIQERVGSALVVRLNRPEARNALTPPLLNGIGAAILEAEADPDVRAVVLTAAGDRMFCVGMDLRAFTSGESFPEGSEADKAAFERFMRGTVRVPIIGAANGTAVGGGFELLLSCDLIVASSAARFGLPEVKRGLIAAGGGAIAVGSRLPLALALELALIGDNIDAERARALGLVNLVVAPEEVFDTALSVAERIAANGPLAVAATKEIVRTAAGAGLAAAWTRMGEIRDSVFTSEDAKEGATSFIEKRPPRWKGR
jgi:enoyl-CoA hydratase/carnithine racemase